jgi:glutamate---cysteine ligase / carboxylate-amine ligase
MTVGSGDRVAAASRPNGVRRSMAESATRYNEQGWPSWAGWNGAPGRRYTIGVEEEVLVLDAADHSLAPESDWVLTRLSRALAAHTSPETHAAVIELTSGVHPDVAGVIEELTALRTQLDTELGPMGLCAASVGTYPLASAIQPRVSRSERYRVVEDSMRLLARREPTLALHVHVGVPDPEDAIRLLNGLRNAVPILLALSANSPFSDGSDTGFASARTVIFQAFPRTGTARRFGDYADYVRAVDGLIASGALRDPSFLWWDVRLQPSLGTVEVRVMDTQTTIADTAALVAFVRSFARLMLEGEPPGAEAGPEVLAENRFLAARDGLDARLIDPVRRELVPARDLLEGLLARCRDHADGVDAVQLDRIRMLAVANGADRQRAWVDENGLDALLPMLARRFARVTRRRPRAGAGAVPPHAGLRSGPGPSEEATETSN